MARLIGDAYISILADTDLFRSSALAGTKKALAGIRPSIPVTADTAQADAKIAALAAALKKLGGEANIKLNMGRALSDVAAMETAVLELMDTLDNLKLDPDDSKGMAKLFSMKSVVASLADQLDKLDADVDMNKFISKIYAARANVEQLQHAVGNMEANIDIAAANAKIGEMKTAVASLAEQLANLRAKADTAALEAKIAAGQLSVDKLARSMEEMPLTANTLPFEVDILKAAATVEALKKEMSDTTLGASIRYQIPSGNPFNFGTLNVGGLNNSEAQMMDSLARATLDASVAYERLYKDLDNVRDSGGLAATALGFFNKQSSMIVQSDLGGWLGAANTKIRLFGGILDSILPKWASAISLWHLGADVILEFAAAWGPALIAVGTFAAYAYPVGEKIYGQWKNINTILDGVGGRLPDLGKSFDQVERAIEPSILIAFGEYMSIIGRNAAPLGAALTKVGNVVDAWGADLVAWSGRAEKGFDSFVSSGAKDFAEIGYGFQQVFRIVGSLFHDFPGYVHILLLVGDAFLTVAADLVQFLGPLIKAGLYVHGFIVYVGLAVTAIVALGRAMAAASIASYARQMGQDTNAAGEEAEGASGKFNKFGSVIGNVAGIIGAYLVKGGSYVKSVYQAGKVSEEAGGGFRVAASGAKILGDVVGIGTKLLNPWADAAVLGAAAVGVVLYFALRKTTTAAEAFNNSIQTLISKSNFNNIGENLTKGFEQTTIKLQQTNAQMADFQKSATYVSGAYKATGGAYNTLSAAQRAYISGQNTVINDAENYGRRMAALIPIFGSTAGAQQALTLMNISAGQVAKENNKDWQLQYTELVALAKGYGYMGQAAGAAGNQLDILNITSGTTYKNIQALTQAEQQWIGVVTSGDSAFTSFAQGQATLMTDLKQGGVSARTTLGTLSTTFTTVKTNLNGTTASALAARSAFDQQVQAATTLFGNMQMLAGAAGNTSAANTKLTDGGKQMVAMLLKQAAGSKEATAEVYSLAQIVGYTGPDSFASLVKWLGKTSGSMSQLDGDQSNLTIGAAKLSTAAKNLGNALETSLVSAEANAIAKSFGLDNAINGLAQNVQEAGHRINSAAVSLSGEYYAALIKSGDGTADAKSKLDAYLTSLGYTKAQINEINGTLGQSVPAWEKYAAEQTANTNASKALASATKVNAQMFNMFFGEFPGGVQQFNNLWAAIGKEDGALAQNINNTNSAKQAFASFAVNGLDVTRQKADELWQKFASNNLDYLATHAESTKQHFINFAENGLHLSAQKAAELWQAFAMNNLDMLMTKGDSAKAHFIDFARNGLDLTSQQATVLWNTLRNQYLDTVAAKAGETRGAFERTAAQFGLTKQAADTLWNSLHKLAAGSPYGVNVNETLTGSGKLVAKVSGNSVVIAASGANASSQSTISASNTVGKAAGSLGKAAGGLISGGIHGIDSVPAFLAPGELVIPASHAPSHMTQAKREGVPGLAGGGMLGMPQVNANDANTNAGVGTMMNAAVAATANGMSQFIASLNNTMSALANPAGAGNKYTGAASFGGGFESLAALLSFAKYFMANGLNAAAAAGMAATISGEEDSAGPESEGSGGFGLIGWTGNTVGLPAGYHGPTGNVAYDLAEQLAGVIGYMNSRGGAGPLNAAGNPVLAGDVWSRYEAPLVPLSDTRPAVANELYALLTSSSASQAASGIATQKRVAGQLNAHSTSPHSAGGMVSEPVYGFGAYSGMPYSFAENYPEYVGPISGQGSGSNMMQPMTNTQGQQANAQLGMIIKLLQQMPYAQAQAISQAGSKGVISGYFGAQA